MLFRSLCRKIVMIPMELTEALRLQRNFEQYTALRSSKGLTEEMIDDKSNFLITKVSPPLPVTSCLDYFLPPVYLGKPFLSFCCREEVWDNWLDWFSANLYPYSEQWKSLGWVLMRLTWFFVFLPLCSSCLTSLSYRKLTSTGLKDLPSSTNMVSFFVKLSSFLP